LKKNTLRALSAPVMGPDRSIAGTVTVLEDITAFKQLDQMKSDFVNMVAHELRSPLVAIRQLNSVLLEGLAGPMEEKQQDFIRRGMAKIDSLLNLINDLLDIAKLEAGKFVQHQVPTDIGKIIEETIALMEPRAQQNGIELKYFIENLKPVQADPKRIEEIFNNLISNANNYSPEGGRVTVSAKDLGEYMEIRVEDTGVGITEEELPKIFELIKLKWTILRSAVIGTMIGILPGVGATTAAFVGYSEAVRWSKHPEKFGTGIPEGIAAPETCNNAAAGGAMVPLLTLGIPGSATTAVIIGGFMVHGMQPGPMLFINQPGLMYSLFIAMFVANIFMLFSGIIVAKLFSNFRKIRYSILGPCIFVFASVGAFGISNSMVDVWIMFAFGLIGYAMKKFDFPIAPLIIALVLGELAEISLRRGMRMADWDVSDFIFRPIGGTILFLTLITLLFTIYGKIKKKPNVLAGAIPKIKKS